MKRIITSNITDPSIQQPFTGKSLEFLQDSIKENDFSLIAQILNARGLTYSASTPYKLWQEGATSYSFVLFGGEIYYMDENVPLGANIAILNNSNDPVADPVTFSDGVSRSVHHRRRITQTVGTLGTGLFNLSAIKNINTPLLSNAVSATGFVMGADWTIGNAIKWRMLDISNSSTGVVYLEGSATSNVATPSTLIFTLPVGFIPSVDRYVPCVYNELSTSVNTEYLIIKTNGEVLMPKIITGATHKVYFDGVSFIV